MATVVLIRHGRTTANSSGTLAGRLPGVRLDAVGQEQVANAAARLAEVPLSVMVVSPLVRCRETAAAVAAAQSGAPEQIIERGVVECDYGEWQGRPLKELSREPLWKVVQAHPAAARFPGGESLADMQARAVAAVRRHDAAQDPGAVWAVVSHGDLIKALLADALGMHLDLFQRLQVDPASISIVRYGETRPHVFAMNTHAGDLGWLRPPPKTRTRSRKHREDAAVGGGAGPGAPA
ncbi:MAG: MSMEG_4193 family putative phosphomutase [Nocardioides sp.]